MRACTCLAVGLLVFAALGACGYDERDPSVAAPAPLSRDSEVADDAARSSTSGAAPTPPTTSETSPAVTEVVVPGSSVAAEATEPPAPPEMPEPKEAVAPLPTCSHEAAFGAPAPVPGLPLRAVRLRTSPDERLGYYAWPSATFRYDLLVATRETRSSAFGEGESLAFNDAGWDFSPTLPNDNTVLYLESNRSGSWKLYQSEWDAEAQVFGPLAFPAGLSNSTATYNDGGPFISADGAVMYFHTNRLGRQLLASARRSGDSFGPIYLIDSGAVLIGGFPAVSPDELTMYFAAEVGSEAEGKHEDIWSASRSSTSEAFTNFREVAGVNTPANEVPSFISADGCRLYFDRNTGFPFSWGRTDDTAYFAERQLEQ
ncbi:MAG TPA: hypothetical protein VJU61_01225 [Polyangiaceae bacterium]|nr:hypothetical protein [Polyangiaceae bacterium]